MAFNLFPYSNFHKLNLDWVIQQIKEAMAAVQEAAQTVSSYSGRVAELEHDVGVLQTSVAQLNTNVQQISQDILDLPTIRSTAEQAAAQAALAVAAAEAADDAATTALSEAQSAAATAESIAGDKLDVASPTATGRMTISQGSTGGLTLMTYTDAQNNSSVQLNNANGRLELKGQTRVAGTVSNFDPRILNVGAPIDGTDAANKTYVDNQVAPVAQSAAQSAASITLLGREKLDKLGADAQEELGVTGNPESTEYPFYIKVTGTDAGDYEMVRAKAVSRNMLQLSSESKVGNGMSIGSPVIRGVDTPKEAFDAANKAYVDGFVSNVIGTVVEITPAANSIYKCMYLDQLTITSPPATGAYSIVFTSGSTPTTTIIPLTIMGLETFVAEANTLYEINVLDNRAVVGSWEVV